MGLRSPAARCAPDGLPGGTSLACGSLRAVGLLAGRRAVSLGANVSTRRRIALVGPAAPYRGGIAHFSNRLACALAARHEVRLLTFARQYPALLFPGAEQLDPASWELPSRPERLIDSLGPASWRRAGAWLAEQASEVALLAWWHPYFAPAYLGTLRAWRARSRRGCACALVHNLLPHEPAPLARPLLRRFAAAMDGFVTLEPSVTAALRALCPNAPIGEGFHPAYDDHPAAPARAAARRALGLRERPTLLCFGIVRRYKGLDVLVDALGRLRERVDAGLLVVGEFYADEARIRRRVAQAGLSDAVRIEPRYVPHDEVPLWFAAADVVVQPYRRATASGVVGTALHFGRPVVATRVGALEEAVGDQAGVCVAPGDPKALADGILEVLERDADALAEAARARARLLSWDALADRIDTLLEGIAS